jgi:hypothetical protein
MLKTRLSLLSLSLSFTRHSKVKMEKLLIHYKIGLSKHIAYYFVLERKYNPPNRQKLTLYFTLPFPVSAKLSKLQKEK